MHRVMQECMQTMNIIQVDMPASLFRSFRIIKVIFQLSGEALGTDKYCDRSDTDEKLSFFKVRPRFI